MPGLEGDLEEWQTQEVNVTRGEAEGPGIICFVIPDSSIFHAHINIHYFYPNTLVFVGDNSTGYLMIYSLFILVFCQHMQLVPLPLPECH